MSTETMDADINIRINDLEIVSVHQLDDGRMEIQWYPVDRSVDEEFAYLAGITDMPVSRTKQQCIKKDDLIHYLFDKEGKWFGIRCPKEVWKLYMKAKDMTDDAIHKFVVAWTKSPMKQLIDKELVDQVRSAQPWTGLE